MEPQKVDFLDLPGSFTYDNNGNPTLYSPFTPYELPYYQTRESLRDVDFYKRFIDNAISRFHHSRFYKQYKNFLYELGLDRSAVSGNINSEMASIEMHHNALTIYDIAIIITEHVLNTRGYINSFELVQLLKNVHKEHKVQLVMLTKTEHQMYHNEDGMFLSKDLCFGDWVGFIYEYYSGLTLDIAYKLLYYINENISTDGISYDSDLLELREKIKDWSGMNERFSGNYSITEQPRFTFSNPTIR